MRRGERYRVHTMRSVPDLRALLAISDAGADWVECSADSLLQVSPPTAPLDSGCGGDTA